MGLAPHEFLLAEENPASKLKCSHFEVRYVCYIKFNKRQTPLVDTLGWGGSNVGVLRLVHLVQALQRGTSLYLNSLHDWLRSPFISVC